MTMIHPPSAAPAGPPRPPGDPGSSGHSPDPGPRGGFRVAGIPVTLTPGAYLLGVLAAGFSAIALPAVDPGRSVAGYLAAAVGRGLRPAGQHGRARAGSLDHGPPVRPPGAGHRRPVRRAPARPGPAARIVRGAGAAQPPRPVARGRGGAADQPAAGRGQRGRGRLLARARRRPAGRRRGRRGGLDQRPAGRGQPGSGSGTGWRADRPSAGVGALGRFHPRGTHRRPLRPGQRGDPDRRRGDRAGARPPGRASGSG